MNPRSVRGDGFGFFAIMASDAESVRALTTVSSEPPVVTVSLQLR
jgi:hypothetical protein